MTYKFYPLKETSKAVVKEFFAALFGWRPEFDVRVLKDEEYDRLRTHRETACLETSVEKGDTTTDNLLLRADRVKRVIKIRLLGDGMCVADVMHEMLHMYYPQATEEIIIQAETAFKIAFLCYDTLYPNQPQRDFFVQLCKEGDRLIKWAGLPKFDFGKIRAFEKELLAEVQDKEKAS
jgi:hypothetical protein